MSLGCGLHKRETQTSAADRACLPKAASIETIKHLADVGWIDPNALILYGEPHFALFMPDDDRHMGIRRGVLNSVLDQIVDGVLDCDAIDIDFARRVVAIQGYGDPPLVGLCAEPPYGAFRDLGDTVREKIVLILSGLDAMGFQEPVHQLVEIVCFLAYRIAIFAKVPGGANA